MACKISIFLKDQIQLTETGMEMAIVTSDSGKEMHLFLREYDNHPKDILIKKLALQNFQKSMEVYLG